MAKITQQFVDDLTPDGRDRLVFDDHLQGFGIRLTKAGSKLFVARARVSGGKRRFFNLGNADKIKVSIARREAETTLADARAGREPALESLRRKKAAEAGSMTIKALGERWMSDVVNVKRKPRTAEDYQRLLDQRINPTFGSLPVLEITRDEIIAWHARMSNTPRRANYSLATLRVLLNFAEDIGLREPRSNPCRRIQMYREGVRERFLTEAEIGKAADAIAAAETAGKIGTWAAAGLRLALLTGARQGELTAAKWQDFHVDRKIIRLLDSKTNRPRTIHLSKPALEILRTLPRLKHNPYIIAGAKPGEPLQNLSRSWIVARKFAEGLDDVRLHDLRHSFASVAAARGVSLQMIGKLLGHQVAATTQRYAHLAADAAAGVNDELGDVMDAAIKAPRR